MYNKNLSAKIQASSASIKKNYLCIFSFINVKNNVYSKKKKKKKGWI